MILFERQLPQGQFVCFQTEAEIPHPYYRVHQVHGDNVILAPAISSAHERSNLLGEADGISIPCDANVPSPSEQRLLVIVTADCLPVVILGRRGYAMLHAGWKGLAQKILLSPEIEQLGPYYAFIGPSIQVEQYTVGPDFRQNFHESNAFKHKDLLTYFNLQQEATTQLQRAYQGIKVEDCGECTFSQKKYQSYRREKVSGRNWNCFFPWTLDNN